MELEEVEYCSEKQDIRVGRIDMSGGAAASRRWVLSLYLLLEEGLRVLLLVTHQVKTANQSLSFCQTPPTLYLLLL